MYNDTTITHPSQSHVNEVCMPTLTRNNTVQQFIEHNSLKSMMKRPPIDLVNLKGVMNCSAAPTSTLAITNCSKPLRHHQFYGVVARNLDVISLDSF